MHTLILIQNGKKLNIPFSGEIKLNQLLEREGVAHFSPCGGKGDCGKCAVRLKGAVSQPNSAEIKANARLACQAVLLGDAEAELINTEEFAFIETNIGEFYPAKIPDWKYGAAIDIGTTTIALKLYSQNGSLISEASALNPQRSVSADVMGRISASVNGKRELLQAQIINALESLLNNACKAGNITPEMVESLVVTGNTAMMYFLTGYSAESIAVAPFQPDTLFGKYYYEPIKTYLPPCINAFVGADTTCAVLASGMCGSSNISLLCDIGTNGEAALWKNGKLYVTSCAAGPAFEGAEISCGCGFTPDAIYKAYIENGVINAETVADVPPKGLCGSGLIDAIAAFLELGYIDNQGNISSSLALHCNGGKVLITQDDIRALQLAKAAVAAGIEILLARTNTSVDDIENFYLAGGFGTHISPKSAASIGMIPESLADKAQPIGNAALRGASILLFDNSEILNAQNIAKNSIHIPLGGNDDFYQSFIKHIQFPQ